MVERQIINDPLTEKVIGCAINVHKQLGCGFQEVIYQRALALELGNAGVQYNREVEMPIFYNNQDIGTRRADFIIENKLMVELKAIKVLENIEVVQALNYLRIYKLKVGLLINFGNTKIEVKRLVL